MIRKWSRKLVSLVLLFAFILMIGLTGCGGGKGSSAPVDVDKGILTVDVTLASTFFTDQSEDDIKASVKEKGYKSYKLNKDGSVTYTMTKSKHKEILDSFKINFDKTIDDFISGPEKIESFTKIDYNDNISKIDIYVNPDTYSMWDSLYAMAFYMQGAFYQNFAGVPAEDIDVVVEYIDNVSGDILNSASYRDFVDNNTNSEELIDSSVVDVDNSTNLAMNERITQEDKFEFFVEYVSIVNKVIPPHPGSYHSYYEAEDGKVFVDVCLSYKNLSTQEVVAGDVLSGTLIYADKYQYRGFSIIEEDNRSDFTYSNITNIPPLTTDYLHYLFEVPEEIQLGEGSLTSLININNKSYKISIRDGKTGQVSKLNANAIIKSSGVVKKGEIITIPDKSEFFIDYSDITNKVTPLFPSDYHSYYEAEEGKIYVDFCIGYKNWEPKGVEAGSVISAKLIYNGKYEYTGFSMIEEDNRSDFTYSNITEVSPLTTEYIHYLFEVPAEVGDGGTVLIEFKIAGNEYSYSVK